MYAVSVANMRRYSKVLGIRSMCGGFSLGVKRSHLCSHAAVIVPCFWLCDHRRSMSRARLFAATSVRSHPLQVLSVCGAWRGEHERFRPATSTRLLLNSVAVYIRQDLERFLPCTKLSPGERHEHTGFSVTGIGLCSKRHGLGRVFWPLCATRYCVRIVLRCLPCETQ